MVAAKVALCPAQIGGIVTMLTVGLLLMVMVCAVAEYVPQVLVMVRFKEYVPELLNLIEGVTDCEDVPEINW